MKTRGQLADHPPAWCSFASPYKRNETNRHTHTHTRTHTHTHGHTHTHTHTTHNTHTRTDTQTHTHTQNTQHTRRQTHTHTQVIEKALVLLGYPRRVLFSAKNVVYLSFKRLSAKSVGKPDVFKREPVNNSQTTPRLGLEGGGAVVGVHWSQNGPSFTIETALARPRSFASPRPLARTNETKRFPGWGHKGSSPQPPIYTHIDVYI